MKKSCKRLLACLLCVSLLLGCGLFGAAEDPAAPAAGETAPFRLSCTVNGDPATQRGFCWYTRAETASVLELTLADGTPVDAAVDYADVTEWNGNYMHKALATGLQPGTTYIYRLGDGTTFTEPGVFVTDDRDDRVEFLAVADIQASSLENFQRGAAAVDAAFRTLPGAEFMLNLGDFTNDSTNEEWDYYAQAMDALSVKMTLAPIAGNHDGLGVWHWFENLFCLDTSRSVQNLNGVNYSFDYGNVHIAVVNTNDLLSVSLAQLRWLRNDLNGTDKDWKIICMHKSPYTLGKDGKWPDAMYLQRALTKVADDCGVDLVLSGHDHQYLRTKPLKGNKLDPDGTTYVLCGTAGTKRYEVRPFLADHFMKTEFIDALTVQRDGWANYWDGEDWEQSDPNNIGGCFNTFSVEGGTLTLKSYILRDEPAEDGSDVITNIDTLTLTKETGQNKITYTGDNTTGTAAYALNVVPSFFALAGYAFGEWLPKFLAMLPDLIKVYSETGIF